MFKPIIIGLSPNIKFPDVKLSLQILFKPWTWKHGKYIKQVENWFIKYFNVKYAVSFNAGRSALLVILQSLGLTVDDEVMVQAFTCIAVPNSIRWAKLKPVFIDIDETINIDVSDAKNKLTTKTKVLIVQHTFGIPANMEKIKEFCQQNKLILLEDCAHALGATFNGVKLGTYGDAAFFSFGRDKIVSSVFGGMAITNNENIGKKILQIQQKLAVPNNFWIFQQLLHPTVTYLSKKTYNFFKLGRILLFGFQKLHLLSMPVYQSEKLGIQPGDFSKTLPNALAKLALLQLESLDVFNQQRRLLAKLYFADLDKNKYKLPYDIKGAIYLRYNVLTSQADKIRAGFKKHNIVLGNWYHMIIDPQGVKYENIGYKLGSCPQAEQAAQNSLNLPTYPTLKISQVKHTISMLNHLN